MPTLEDEVEALRARVQPMTAAMNAYAIVLMNEGDKRKHIWQYEKPWPDDPRLAESHQRDQDVYAKAERAAMLVVARAVAEALRRVPCPNHPDSSQPVDFDHVCQQSKLRTPYCLRCYEVAAAEALVAWLEAQEKGEQR